MVGNELEDKALGQPRFKLLPFESPLNGHSDLLLAEVYISRVTTDILLKLLFQQNLRRVCYCPSVRCRDKGVRGRPKQLLCRLFVREKPNDSNAETRGEKTTTKFNVLGHCACCLYSNSNHHSSYGRGQRRPPSWATYGPAYPRFDSLGGSLGIVVRNLKTDSLPCFVWNGAP